MIVRGFSPTSFSYTSERREACLTRRNLPRNRDTVSFHSGDLAELVNTQLKPNFRSIWIVGGGALVGECVRRELADEIRYTIAPVLIGSGIPFFQGLDLDVALHLEEVKAYTSGLVALRYIIRK
jgi:dihydrofolate reductase